MGIRVPRPFLALPLAAVLLSGAAAALFGTCGPFSDTANDAFCPFVLEAFYTGITTGTTATTYDPAVNVTRLQMAAFLSRTVDGVLRRGSRHAALRRFWTPKGFGGLGVTTVGGNPRGLDSDGMDIWAAAGNNVPRIRGSDGKLLETWTGATIARSVLSAVGRIFVTGGTSPGSLSPATGSLSGRRRTWHRSASSTRGAPRSRGAPAAMESSSGSPSTVGAWLRVFEGGNMRIANRTAAVSLAAALLAGAASALFSVCGPFSDTADDAFCPFVLEVFYTGITTGTTPTTYSPADNVSRLQMAAFLSRTVDGVLKRGRGDAALKKFWTTQGEASLGLTTVGTNPVRVESDGLDVWVSQLNTVSRVRASDGKLLETWTGASTSRSILSTMGRIFVTALTTPGRLYRIDPSQAAGAVTTVTSTLGIRSDGIAFDGSRIWTANLGDGTSNTGSVSIVTPGAAIPFTVTTVTAGFSEPQGALYDGANVWVTDQDLNRLFKLDSAGAILQTVTVGTSPEHAVFDGTNIWVPNVASSSVTVVRAFNGAILATLTGNGLSSPSTAAFDGLRVLVTNSGGNSVSLWKAADLSAIGSSSTGAGTSPAGACSDGIQFWVALFGSGKLARF